MIPRNNELRFEIATKCNYHCLICPRNSITRKQEIMSLGLFKKLLDKITNETSQYDTLTFPGMGEPLLDPTIEDKVAYARNKKFKILILTNGSLLSINKFNSLESLGVESIRVSIYGNDPVIYAKVHGLKNGKVFEKIRSNLTRIAKVKKKTKLLLTFNLVNGLNEHCLSSWIAYWKDKADLLEVWRPHNWVNGRSYRPIQNERLKTCGRPWNTPLQVQVDGTVNMCCFDFNGELTLGDLKKQSLKEIFSSPLYKKIIKHHKTGDFKNSRLICEICDQRNRDKTGVMVYSSNSNIDERVGQYSTTYINFKT